MVYYSRKEEFAVSSSSVNSETMAAALGILGSLWLIILALVVLQIVSQWKLFTKAGKPGWASIIPFYSQYLCPHHK